VLRINVRTDEILSNISVAVLHGISEDYFKINNYNWQRAKIAGTGEQHFYPYNDVMYFN
jgi:hypothetical protein